VAEELLECRLDIAIVLLFCCLEKCRCRLGFAAFMITGVTGVAGSRQLRRSLVLGLSWEWGMAGSSGGSKSFKINKVLKRVKKLTTKRNLLISLHIKR
jgi:hypothetical protein